MDFLISCQATESDENYGQQIIWKDKARHEFEIIEMRPPSSPKDNRKISDITTARYNLRNQIPIGRGIFIVKPYALISGSSTI
ncbi:hypothetical protein [Peribacillus sp. TH14]|uniref:hypothetical protein n=1 Tax=Peribacillus sp. TH14 TaxID=2798481 RepID=UPI001912EEDB|nr:hypothetical protein [Peribacillus sp. TH14]MBK5500154.1 hypothetical protein [Peribacillus sp. TH14]